MRRRATLLTLFLLAVLCAVPVLLTWQQVRQEMLNQQLGRAFQQWDRREVLALLVQGADANTLVPDEDEDSPPSISMLTLLRQRLVGSKPPPATGAPCLLWALGIDEATAWFPAGMPHDDPKPPPEDPDLIVALLRHGARINIRGKNGKTPLLLALGWRYERVAILLVHQHADVNLADENGYTPLMEAVMDARDKPSSLSILNLLLTSGARINARDTDKQTPLIHGFAHGKANIPVVEFLLAHGADIDAQGESGRTALIYAVWNRDLPAVRLLLAHHANVNLQADDEPVLKYADDSDSGSRDEAIIALLKHAGAKE